MSKNDISFYLLMVGMILTLVSIMGGAYYSHDTDICIIDTIMKNETSTLSNCKSTIGEEYNLLYVGVIGVIMLGASTGVQVWSRK